VLLSCDAHARCCGASRVGRVAARLESEAAGGEILASAPTCELAGEGFALRSHGVVQVKGKGQGVSVFEVEGVFD
jgi:class 3 adenylate cyclase